MRRRRSGYDAPADQDMISRGRPSGEGIEGTTITCVEQEWRHASEEGWERVKIDDSGE